MALLYCILVLGDDFIFTTFYKTEITSSDLPTGNQGYVLLCAQVTKAMCCCAPR